MSSILFAFGITGGFAKFVYVLFLAGVGFLVYKFIRLCTDISDIRFYINEHKKSKQGTNQPQQPWQPPVQTWIPPQQYQQQPPPQQPPQQYQQPQNTER